MGVRGPYAAISHISLVTWPKYSLIHESSTEWVVSRAWHWAQKKGNSSAGCPVPPRRECVTRPNIY